VDFVVTGGFRGFRFLGRPKSESLTDLKWSCKTIASYQVIIKLCTMTTNCRTVTINHKLRTNILCALAEKLLIINTYNIYYILLPKISKYIPILESCIEYSLSVDLSNPSQPSALTSNHPLRDNTLILTPPRHNPGIGKLSSSWKFSVMLCLRMQRICLFVADEDDTEAANIPCDFSNPSRDQSTIDKTGDRFDRE